MDLKKYLEMRAEKQEEMKKLIEAANNEERALREEERTQFDELEAEIRELDGTIQRMQSQRELEQSEPMEDGDAGEEKGESDEENDIRALDAYIRNGAEEREAANITAGANGAVVPSSIAQKIIQKVVDMCPIYQDATRYNVKGTLSIPYYDESTGDIQMEYADEFTEGESTGGKFKSISLKGFLARAICDVSKSLINNSQFNIVDFVITRMSRQISLFLERELLKGTEGKVEGLSGIGEGMTVTTGSAAKITADEIIDLQEAVPDRYQQGAYFIMNKATRTAVRKLKDGQGNYLLNKDANSRWGYTLFGKDVYTSDNMDKIGAGNTVMLYGDYSGLAVKVSEEVNIEVLRETKARQHVVEVLGFVEFDAKIENGQKIAQMKMKAEPEPGK